MRVRVPASSANLGPGFDALGLALGEWAEIGEIGDEPVSGRARPVDEHHPATIAYRRAGGRGRIWVRSSIPNGRGMGFSGAMRVGGAALGAVAGSDDPIAVLHNRRDEVFAIAADLEGHADNAAASVYGGVVAVAAGVVVPVPLGVEPEVVLWVRSAVTASTDASRAALPTAVSFADAADTVGRTALVVASLAAGDTAALATAMDDRFHQPVRLRTLPGSAAAIEACRRAGAWCAWLSGSGPTVAAMCALGEGAAVAARVAEAMGDRDGARVRSLRVSRRGVEVV